MNSKYIFVTDCPCDETLYHAVAFNKAECMFVGMSLGRESQIVRRRKSLLYMMCLKTVYKVLRNSTERDVIITPDFSLGAYTIVLSKLSFRRRTVVALDLMLHQESSKLPFKARELIYRWVLRNPNFHFSVPRKDIMKKYKSLYQIGDQRVFELNGCYKDCPSQEFSQGDKYVLCAGKRRDWNTFFRTAKLLPKIRFVGIAEKRYFDSDLLRCTPKNLEMVYDIPESEFYAYLSRCAVVCIPVENDWTDKMILFQAAFMNKPLVCTNTPVLTSIVVKGETEGALLAKRADCQTMAVHVDDLLNIPWKAEDLAKKMNEIVQDFSPYNFSRRILDYVHPLRKKAV